MSPKMSVRSGPCLAEESHRCIKATRGCRVQEAMFGEVQVSSKWGQQKILHRYEFSRLCYARKHE